MTLTLALTLTLTRRVASPPPPSERNFHIFYMLAARQAGSLLPAGRGAQSFRCLWLGLGLGLGLGLLILPQANPTPSHAMR